MISNVLLGTSETDICVSGASETRALLSMTFCNTSSSTVTITIYVYPSGGSASNTTTVLKEVSLPAKDTFVWSSNEKLILDANNKVTGIASTDSVVSAMSNYMVI